MQPLASPADLPARIRVFPLGGAVLFPRSVMPLNIFEPRYLEMVRDAMAGDQLVGIVQPREDWRDDRPDLYTVGGLGRITQFSESGDGRLLIALTGVTRFRIADELPATTPYRQVLANYTPYAADWSDPGPLAATTRVDLEDALKGFLAAQGLSADWDAVKGADDENLVNTLSVVCPFAEAERQALLEADTLADRTQTLVTLMRFAGAPGGRA